jgi:hypothetical protein
MERLQVCAYLSPASSIPELLAILFYNFSLNKSCLTYLRPMVSSGGRKWQLIYPYCSKLERLLQYATFTIVLYLLTRYTIQPFSFSCLLHIVIS